MKRRLSERMSAVGGSALGLGLGLLIAGIFLAIPAGVAFLLWALGFYLLEV